MRYTIFEGKLFVSAKEEPRSYGDFVGELLGKSRYIDPELPLFFEGADPERSYGCLGYVAFDEPAGLRRTTTSPKTCEACKFRLPCGMGIKRVGTEYSFAPIPGRALKLPHPFDLARFKKENEFVSSGKLTRKRTPHPEDFEW